MVNTSQISLIDKTIETIEKHLEFPINLDILSHEVGLSKYHLQRLFKALTNTSLMHYIRGRRLSLSLHDLLHTDMNIIDIAIKYQFNYEQSYIRAFQNQFHLSPAKYRKSPHEVKIIQKLDVSTLTEFDQGIAMLPKMVIKPAFYVQGIKEEIFHQQNLVEYTTNKLAHKFRDNYLPGIPNRVNEHIYLAIIQYASNPLISNYYIPCVETSCLNKSEPPLISLHLPAQEYAVFRYVGLHAPTELTYKTLLELYDFAYHWFDTSNYIFPGKYHYERMDLNICSESFCVMDIYMPIVTKEKLNPSKERT